MTIVGNGATITRSSAAGTADVRFFVIDTNGNLDLSNLTLSNGSIPSAESHGGGAILNRDHLTATGVGFLNNNSMGEAGGGAVDNHDEDVLTVTNSTFASNVALEGGPIEGAFESRLDSTAMGSAPICGSQPKSNAPVECQHHRRAGSVRAAEGDSPEGTGRRTGAWRS